MHEKKLGAKRLSACYSSKIYLRGFVGTEKGVLGLDAGREKSSKKPSGRWRILESYEGKPSKLLVSKGEKGREADKRRGRQSSSEEEGRKQIGRIERWYTTIAHFSHRNPILLKNLSCYF